MTRLLIIAAGGAVGAVLRYTLGGLLQRLGSGSFPVGTLGVNLAGCLLIGLCAGLFAGPYIVREEYRLFVLVGVLGAFTTFSTFGFETFGLLNEREYGLALLNVALSNILDWPRFGWGIVCQKAGLEHDAMKIPDEGFLLRIFIGESDKYRGKPLYEAIVLKARELHLAGATVLRGPMGFGKASRLHTAKILRLSEDLPIVIEIVDSKDKLDTLLPHIDEMMRDGLVTLERVQIIKYRAGDDARQ